MSTSESPVGCQALLLVSRGLLGDRALGDGPDEHTLGDVYESSLAIVCRLVFLVVAGRDDLLPEVQDGYEGDEEYLLQALELLEDEVDSCELGVEVLGAFYENLLGFSLRFSGDLHLVRDDRGRKKSGTFYTPGHIVEFIVAAAVGPLLEELKVNHRDGLGLVDAVLELNIVDPAMGAGYFLVEAIDFIARFLMAGTGESSGADLAFWRRRVAQSCVFGMDIDERAVELARLTLWLHVVPEDDPFDYLTDHFRCCDSLIEGETHFDGIGDGFDAVVGNPPYIDSEEMVRSAPKLRALLSDRFECASGNWDIFVLFVELALRLCRDGGNSALIVPNKLLGSEYAVSVQRLLLENRLREIRDYSSVAVFADADVYPVVYCVTKEAALEGAKVIATKMKAGADGTPEIFWHEEVALSSLRKLPQGYWWPLFSSNRRLVINYLQGATKLTDVVDIIDAATVGEAYEIRDILFEKPDFEHGVEFKLVNTGTIDAYEPRWGEEKIQYIKRRLRYPVVRGGDLGQISEKRLSQARGPKVVIAGMVKDLECFFDENGEYLAGKSTTILKGKPELLEVLTALLNSKFYSFIYREIFGSLAMQGGYLTVGPPQLRRLLVPEMLLAQDSKSKAIRAELVELRRRARELREMRQRLRRACDPFNYLDRSAEVVGLNEALCDELRIAEPVSDLGSMRHDIDGLRLHKEGDRWEFRVLLKKRDPLTDWSDWARDGQEILRQWVTVYRFDEKTSDSKSRLIYLQQVFDVFDEFEKVGRFPGGKTRTTGQKLDLIKVPRFDPTSDLSALAELNAELSVVQTQIIEVDGLINNLMYLIFGLMPDEVARIE